MTLVVVALLLVALLGLAALAIDMGMLYTARTSAQHAADAAALAGASTFVFDPTATQPTAAQNAAIAMAGANKILGTTVSIAASNITVDTTNRRVTVTVPRTGTNGIGTFFAKALGISRVDVQAQATAQASLSAAGTRCIKPIYMPNTVLSTLAPASACTASPPQVIFDSSHNVTSWAQSRLDQCTLIRPTSPQDVTRQGFSAGQFFSLDFGSGANTYRCTWSSCLNNATCNADQSIIACGSSYPVATGDMTGPTNQGVGDLVGNPADLWVGPGQYQNSSTGTISDTSHQLAVVPVWDDCAQVINSGTAGQTATVIGFVTMFVDGMTNQNGCTANGNGNGNGNGGGQWVEIHPIDATGCGSGGGGGSTGGGGSPTGSDTSAFSVPVQLVQNPSP